MAYKKRLVCLLALIAVLALFYIGSFVFSYDMGNTRSASYAWLDSRDAGRITRIAFNTGWEEFELAKRGDQWFVSHNGSEYPARLLRVEDFLRILTTRSSWPVRSTSASYSDRFGLNENAARVTVYSEQTPLLDLLIGDEDPMGREAYFRRAGQNEVRSGDSSINMYISGRVASWYNLRLVSESEGGNVNVGSVQRLSVRNGEGTQNVQQFSRRNRGWDVTGIVTENLDHNSIENYIRDILNTEGSNFVDSVSSFDPVFNHSNITLEFGNGRVVNIRLTDGDEEGHRLANVSGREYIYSIPVWIASRLFRDAASFEMQ